MVYNVLSPSYKSMKGIIINVYIVLLPTRDTDSSVGDPDDWGMNPVTDVAFTCAAIHFPTVYTVSSKSSSSHTCLYDVEG